MIVLTARTVAVVALLASGVAGAQRRGSGSGESSVTPPPGRGAGAAMESAQAGARHGPMPARMREADQTTSAGGQSYETWKSGDLVRSASSADVRAARRQQAPDMEWAGEQRRGR
jgi:hypothetical protein